jgi:23S rRNA pseudouridine2605 synthase
MPADRLHKVMAAAGIASRRKCEEIIAAGRVRVNGKPVREMGVKVDLSIDVVEVNGKKLRPQRLLLLAMNKPKGVVTTMKDELGRRTVTDLLPELEVTVKPVGRLDKDTEGLLLFTNDGDLAARLTHPRYGVWKTYDAIVDGVLKPADVEKLRKGLWIHLGEEAGQGRKTAAAKVTLKYADELRKQSRIEISIHEGAKRQVRLMIEAVGAHVKELKRTHFGPIALGKLPPGACKMLSKVEESKLRQAVALEGFSGLSKRSSKPAKAAPPARRGKPRDRSRGSGSSGR